MKKLLTLLMATIMVLAMATTAFATDYVAEIDGVQHETLSDAISAAEAGETITVLADCTLYDNETGGYYTLINKDLTIDLNGKTVDVTNSYYGIYVYNGAKLTVIDSGENGTMTTNIEYGYLFYVNNGELDLQDGYFSTTYGYFSDVVICAVGSSDASAENFTVITVGEDATVYCDNSWAISIARASSTNVCYGLVVDIFGTVTGNEDAYYGKNAMTTNGLITATTGNIPQITFHDGCVIDGKVYLAGYGEYTVNGGTFNSGMELKIGEVVINDGTFIGSNDYGHEPNSGGTSTYGYALAVVNNSAYTGGSVTVNGGTFDGLVEVLYDNDPAVEKMNFAIKGGYYENQPKEAYIVTGYKASDEATEGYYTIVNVVEETVTETMDTVAGLTTETVTGNEEAINTAAGTVATIPTEDLLDHVDEVNNLDALFVEANSDLTVGTELVELDSEDYTIEDVVVEGLGLAVYGGETIAAETVLTLKVEQSATDDTVDLAFTAKPYVKVGAGDETQVSNDDISTPITFNVYLPDTFTSNYATVEHYFENGGSETLTCKVQNDNDGQGNYIRITVTEFSRFEVTQYQVATSTGSVKKYSNDLEVGDNGSAYATPLSAASGTIVYINPTADFGYRVAEVTVDGGDIDVTDEGDGTYSYKQPAYAVEIEVTFESDGTGRTEEEAEEVEEEVEEDVEEEVTEEESTEALTAFEDLVAGAWYEEYIAAAVEATIMQGNSETEFAPNGTTTRAMMIQVLFNLEDQPETENDEAAWYSEALAWGVEFGITDGSEITGDLTREQLVTMLYRYAMSNGVDTSAAGDLTTFGDTVTISDEVTLSDVATIVSGVELIVANGATLEIESGGSITNNGTIVVNDGTNLVTVLNATATTSTSTVKLGSNIALTGAWTPIGSTAATAFKGTLDGNSKTISDLNVTGTSNNAGLFGYIDGATIKDLTVKGSVSGGTYVGGIVGYAEGKFTISNCTFGSEDDTSTVSGTTKVAGILGATPSGSDTGGSITGCTNYGDITIEATSGECAAGIVGYARSVTISGCINNGDVTSNSQHTGGIMGYGNACDIDNCTNTGDITGTTTVGGIAGANSDSKSTIDNCTNSGLIAGVQNVGQIVSDSTNFTLESDNANTENGIITIDGIAIFGPLKFESTTEGSSNDYYTWDATDKELTLLKDMTIEAGSSYGITFTCAGATIVVAEKVKLTISSSKYGIYDDTSTSTDTLTITNNGTIDITTTGYNAINIGNGSISITGGTLDIETNGDAIYASSGVTIDGGDVDIEAGGRGIAAYSGDIEIKNAADVTIVAGLNQYGINTKDGGSITIADSALEITMPAVWETAIYVYEDITVTNSTVEANCIIIAKGLISIDEDSDITASRGICSYLTTPNSITIADGATITGYTADAVNENYEYAYVIYTDVEDIDGWMFYDGDTLDFKSGASLTIPADATTDLSTCTITWENAKFINNGILILPSTTVYADVVSTYITNNGTIIIGTTAYDADGNQSTAPFYGILELYANKAYDGSTYGFTWTKSEGSEVYDTLTIDSDLTITSIAKGIYLEDGGTIILNADLTINSDYGGIYATGDLIIQGTGTLTINSGDEGICAYGDITIQSTGTLTINSDDDYGIYTIAYNNNITITDSTVIDNSYDGIYAYNNITINGTADVTSCYIDAKYNITINGTADITADYVSASGTVEISGTADVTSYNIEADGDITISGTANVTADYIDADGNVEISGSAVVNVSTCVWAKTSITIAETATVNGLVSTNDGEDSYNDTIYGTVEVADSDQTYYMFYYGTLAFAENSDLTINSGVEVDWTDYTITWTNADITNNGIIYLDSTDYAQENIADLGIKGDGYISIWSYDEVWTPVGTYKNDGTTVNTVDDDIYLTADEVTEDTNGYTWIKDEDGVYTLTFTDETLVDGGIMISNAVSDAIINVGDKVTVLDSVTSQANLTITGEGSLTADTICTIDHTEVTLTIDTTVSAAVQWEGELIVNSSLTAVDGVMIFGEVTINGNLTTNMLVAVDALTINTGATVTLTGVDLETALEIPNAPTVALALIDSSFMTDGEPVAPTLTLGSNIGVLSPTGGEYKTSYITGFSDYEFYFGSIATGDDGFEQGDWSNIASSITFGYVKTTSTSTGGSSSSSSSSSSSTTTDAETTTNDDGSVTATVESTSKTSNGTTTVTVDDAGVETAIETAIEEADGETATLEIAVTTKSSTETIEVALSADALSTIADSDVETLTITSDLATVEISSDALAEIVDQAAGEDVTIAIAFVDVADTLTAEQQAMVGSGTVVELTITSDDENVTSFGGYKITITVPYELQDDEDPDNIMVWHIAADGTITVMPTTYDEETGIVSFTTTHFSTFVVVHDINEFEDVEPNDYFYTPVIWAVENEVTTGYTDTTFAPENSCTRAEAVTFLYRAYGEPEVSGEMTFTDVADGIWYADAVLWAVEMGITNGKGDGIFDPNAECTRAEIVSFLYRAAGEVEVDGAAEFNDVLTNAWYADAVEWAVENGVTNGTGDGNFEPNINCTRGQIVTFLYRAMAE